MLIAVPQATANVIRLKHAKLEGTPASQATKIHIIHFREPKPLFAQKAAFESQQQQQQQQQAAGRADLDCE